jgi:adenylylsulfate kinase
MIILITGLPGSGKTTFAQRLGYLLPNFYWLNGDAVRRSAGDWDFSDIGRRRQACRMATHATLYKPAICDFVCPREEYRQIVGADITVWMDTVRQSQFPDTDAIFEQPLNADYIVPSYAEIDISVELVRHRVHLSKSQDTYRRA